MDWTTVIIIVFALMLSYFLWANGYFVTKKVSAILFAGTLRGKNKCKLMFSSCSGFVKKVIKLESGEVNFNLNCEIVSGDFNVEILDHNKNVLLMLSPSERSGKVVIDNSKRNYLVINFKKAEGNLELLWE